MKSRIVPMDSEARIPIPLY